MVSEKIREKKSVPPFLSTSYINIRVVTAYELCFRGNYEHKTGSSIHARHEVFHLEAIRNQSGFVSYLRSLERNGSWRHATCNTNNYWLHLGNENFALPWKYAKRKEFYSNKNQRNELNCHENSIVKVKIKVEMMRFTVLKL